MKDVKKIIEEHANGEIGTLDAFIEIKEERKKLEELISMIKDFESEYFSEIESQSKELGGEYKGFKFRFNKGRTIYDFKNIPEWKEHKESLKECEKRYKSILKAKLNGSKYANITEDGEELILPEISYGSPFVVLTQYS